MSASAIKKLPNYNLIRSFQTKKIKQLNDFFIEVNLTIKALEELRKTIATSQKKLIYKVPKIEKGNRLVWRNSSEILSYIDRRISYSEYAQSIVFAVAIAEDYLQDIMFSILMAYPKKILISSKGNEGDRSISLKDVIASSEIDDLIVEQALNRLNEVMYASPSQYSAYFSKVTGFDLGDQLQKYVEIKATRDLLIHNDGYINSIYIGKCGDLARGVSGDRIVVDASYFEDSVRTLKNISSTVYRGLLDNYGKSTAFAKAVNRHIV